MAGSVWLSAVLVLLMLSTSISSINGDNNRVELALYYETLCPYCSNFMVNYLPTIFQNGLVDIINLKLVPYGNAKIVGPNNTITCQHGPYECLLNTVEACTLHVWPDLNKHYTFIYCVERLVVQHKYTEWESCFKTTGFDSKPIEDCYKGGLGKQFEMEYAKQTNSINPPHRYVPWVTVNGQPLYDDYENFTSYVCKAYKGSVVPKGCKDVHHHPHETVSSSLSKTSQRRQMKTAPA
ncbi:hypothetical protein ACHQM5_020432 [Ranunculus cassubicifolius]